MSNPTLQAGGPTKSSLPLELHTATREIHLALNRQILARLPLCLPLHAHHPLLYAAGITVFGQIYISFERAWLDLLASDGLPSRTRNILAAVKIHGLDRSTRLETDLKELKRRLGQDAARGLEQIQQDAKPLFGDRIDHSIHRRPHVLLAYTWTMYLALFNGGRWIRKQLHDAGQDHDFWLLRQNTTSTNDLPLSFWDFEGDQDGEDIKLAFKQHFVDATAELTDAEKADVVAESKELFGMCLEMVQFLDDRSRLASGQLQPLLPKPDRRGVSWTIATTVYVWWFSIVMSIWQFLLRSCASLRMVRFPVLVQKDVHTE